MSKPGPVSADLRSLYQEIILDHHRRPRHRGVLEGDHLSIHRNNPTCGDEISLHLRLEEGRVAEARFGGHGCSISQAAASMMLDRIQGRTLADVALLTDRFRQMLHGSEEAALDPALGELRALAGVARYPARVRCAMLPWAALEELTGGLPDGERGPGQVG